VPEVDSAEQPVVVDEVVGQQLLDELRIPLVEPPFDVPLELLGAFLDDSPDTTRSARSEPGSLGVPKLTKRALVLLDHSPR
jgi:hypothetical protein